MESAAKGALKDRFKALQRRARESSLENRKEIVNERTTSNPRFEQKSLQKKLAAENKLKKLDAEVRDEDFERKRAWDWTIEETNEWDKHNTQKRINRKQSKSCNYSTIAKSLYDKRIEALIEKRSKSVNKPIETKDSSLSSKLLSAKPLDKDVDFLLENMKNEEKIRVKSRLKQARYEDSGVDYINVRNKRYNEKLVRHYDRFTKEIRDNLERGTAL